MPLNEVRAIDSGPDKANLTGAASKINKNPMLLQRWSAVP
ncbi:DUF1454 family protein [Shigella flexneri]